MKTFKEWKEKTADASQLLSKVQQRIHSITPNAKVILYGSRSRGQAGKFSDWDFLIIIDQPVDGNIIRKIRDSLYEIELESDEIISSIIRTKKEWHSPRYAVLPFKRTVDQDGILL